MRTVRVAGARTVAPSSRNPAKVRVYAPATQGRSASAKCRDAWIEGSATFTTETSSGPGVEHGARRRQIADAVLAVVAERGLPAVSLAEVAAQAGVSAGRVQHYFPTKQKLVEAAFDRGNELSSARIRALVGEDLESAPTTPASTTR
ncbi:TetR family transcriptional regulator [Actinomadura darangshiensis]|uniref:TetR family transcriptional regulator n=1 Tax=Actinomadura darangshiensis TaxID=705336 RepID=UPI001FB7B058|nr:TetR family transcriptional regulator [Actinomadura darangshiensis]